MNIAVTGSAGYIGRALMSHLKCHGHIVKGYDIADVDLAEEDISLVGTDAVVHLAASPSVVASVANPVADARNIIAALRVASAAKEAGCRFVFASSCAVYGNNAEARVDSELKPLSPYGLGKRAVEDYLKWYSERGLKVSILRLGNVTGGDDTRGVWPTFRRAKATGVPASIFGDGSASRSYVDIQRVVRVLTGECGRIDSLRVRNVGDKIWTVQQIAAEIDVPVVFRPHRPGEAERCVLVEEVSTKCEGAVANGY